MGDECITKRVFETTIDLVRKDQSSFEKLIEQISTKGGTTEAGLGVMINSELGDIVDRSFDEAISRVKKVAKVSFTKEGRLDGQ